ncbi:MAG: DUF4127 family protein [Burkholderiales bacterium]
MSTPAELTSPPPSRRLALLPVDARPVVRAQVVQLAKAGGIELVVPPVSTLGHFREPADRDVLADWLRAQASNVQGFVVSLDMLIYGGLVPSRFIADSKESLLARLDVLRQLKQAFLHKPIYAFLATMRISNNNVNDEEKPYWDQYGELIWRWSYYSDQYQVTGDAEANVQAIAAINRIPEAIRDDYLATRARNFAVTCAVLDLVGYEGINGLVLPQDDTARYGFNIAERRELEALVATKKKANWVCIYPGADEVAHTLVAHVANDVWVNAPLKVCVTYSDPDHVRRLVARYEDRPVTASLAAQLAAVDAVVVDDIDSTDLLLAVHTQGPAQGDWAMKIALPSASSINGAWLANLRAVHQSGKPIAVLDLAYANGGDPVLMEQLPAYVPFSELAAYAGWNTASNSIGSLLAQCVLARGAYQTPTNQEVVCLRLVEDYLYQSIWRQRIRHVIDESAVSAVELQAVVAQMFIPAANAWLAEHHFAYRVGSIQLPWQRTFEIDIHLVPQSTLQA